MTVIDLLTKYNLFDNAIRRHGFKDYARDYEILADLTHGTESPGRYRYLFKGCVEVRYELTLEPAAFSMNDELLTDPVSTTARSGFSWGVRISDVYPGWDYVTNSDRSKYWAKRLGLMMHEVAICTNIFKLVLIFHDLEVNGPMAAGSAS